MKTLMTIGELASRTGLTVSAIRFYEARGLVKSLRTGGNQRRFIRGDIRRLSFIMIAQRAGLSLERIQAELASLPQGRNPTRDEWADIATRMKHDLEDRIQLLERMRDRLDGCIGCGCLSLDVCAIYNLSDRAHALGNGPRYLLGDQPITA